MTTLTIILITWFIAGILANVIIIYDQKDDIRIKDILSILLLIALGYLALITTIFTIISANSNKVIWKYPKKN